MKTPAGNASASDSPPVRDGDGVGWPSPRFPGFEARVPQNGYQWWYVDAISDDERIGLTLIAFVGSVFSPYYAWARRRGGGDPENHCALNVALYGPGRKRWSLTERGRSALRRDASHLQIASSRLQWTGGRLEFEIDEMTVPLPGRIQGTIRVAPEVWCGQPLRLDAAGRHLWMPAAPVCRVEVDLRRPAVRWRGAGYLDSNYGSEPLEDAFVSWDWSRAHAGGRTRLLYESRLRDGSTALHALEVAPDGELVPFEAPMRHRLPAGRIWRMGRSTRSEDAPRVIRTLEDTPFYTRSMVAGRLGGQAGLGIHESLCLDRFTSPWVQLLLPFRMPRISR